MSMEYDKRSSEPSPTDAESDMFAATPVWDRARKRRGLGGRSASPQPAVTETPSVAAESRSFAADDPEPIVRDEALGEQALRDERILQQPSTTTNSTLAAEEPAMATPISHAETVNAPRSTRSGGASGAVVAGALVALAAAGGVAWFATQNHGGVAELNSAPASPSAASDVAAAPAGAPSEFIPSQAPAATPAPAPTTPRASEPSTPPPTARTREPTRLASTSGAHRARPAPQASAATGVDASGTTDLPDSPRPYSTLNPGAAPPPTTSEAAPTPPPIEPQQAPATAPRDQTPTVPTPPSV